MKSKSQCTVALGRSTRRRPPETRTLLSGQCRPTLPFQTTNVLTSRDSIPMLQMRTSLGYSRPTGEMLRRQSARLTIPKNGDYDNSTKSTWPSTAQRMNTMTKLPRRKENKWRSWQPNPSAKERHRLHRPSFSCASTRRTMAMAMIMTRTPLIRPSADIGRHQSRQRYPSRTARTNPLKNRQNGHSTPPLLPWNHHHKYLLEFHSHALGRTQESLACIGSVRQPRR